MGENQNITIILGLLLGTGGLGAFLSYIGSRGASKVAREKHFLDAADRFADQLQEQVDTLTLENTRLNDLVTEQRREIFERDGIIGEQGVVINQLEMQRRRRGGQQ